ncbi:MAG: hypothetical protein ACK40M_04800 [Flavobacteriales bacterium]
MSKTFGIVAGTIVVILALLMILQLWGIIHIGFLSFIKSGATLLILLGALIALFVIYGMFIWKGSDLSLREQRELAKKNQSQTKDDLSGRNSDQ